MESGKTFLVAVVSAISTYAALTAWPAIKELTKPGLNGTVVAAQPPSVQLPADSGVTVSSSSIPRRSQPQRHQAASPSQPGGQAPARNRRGRATPVDISSLSLVTPLSLAWGSGDVKFALKTVVLRNKPGGEGVRPVSLNKAPLTVLRGTRLMPIKQKGDWVMVQAPSAEMGWVRERELTDQRPVSADHYSLR